MIGRSVPSRRFAEPGGKRPALGQRFLLRFDDHCRFDVERGRGERIHVKRLARRARLRAIGFSRRSLGPIVVAVHEMIEQMPALLEHVAERRFGPRDADDLVIREGINRDEIAAARNRIENRPQPRLDDLPDQFGRRRFQF